MLSGPQEIALLMLLEGATLTTAAKEAGVTRQTLAIWLREDEAFLSELNSRRAEVWAAVRSRLERRILRAADAIGGLMNDRPWQARAAGCKLALEYAVKLFPAIPASAPGADGSAERPIHAESP